MKLFYETFRAKVSLSSGCVLDGSLPEMKSTFGLSDIEIKV